MAKALRGEKNLENFCCFRLNSDIRYGLVQLPFSAGRAFDHTVSGGDGGVRKGTPPYAG
jgi:hypothetical protein